MPASQNSQMLINKINFALAAGLREYNPIHELWRALPEDEEYYIFDDAFSHLAKFYLPVRIGMISREEFWYYDANLIDSKNNHYGYANAARVFTVRQFEEHRCAIEQMWCGPVIIDRHPTLAGGVSIRPAPSLPAKILLQSPPRNAVALGTNIFTGEVVSQSVSTIPHMLIAGTSGFGKSVFLNAFITQVLAADAQEVAELLLIDLKGGIELHGYARKSNRVQVFWKFDEVAAAAQTLIDLMLARQREMVANNWRLYPGHRVFFIIDEFAQLQLYPVENKDEKATHARLLANLNRLSMLGRAVGIVLIVAIQKPTTDMMDSSFRMNLQGQACFHVPTRLMASTMFGSVDELKLDPTKLTPGRFIYYNPMVGTTQYLQAHMLAE